MQQAKQEIEIRRNASKESEEADKRLKLQERTAQPFIVLSGKGVKETIAAANAMKGMPPPPNKPPGGAGPKGGGASGSKDKQPSGLESMLGGGMTPLSGDRKVQAMLNLNPK